MSSALRNKVKVAFGCVAAVVALCSIYVVTHPLVFNESFLSHAHCMKSAGLGLVTYALDHRGHFPFHTNGYADALALAVEGGYCSRAELSCPGYDRIVIRQAERTGEKATEKTFGRVYVQGLSQADNSRIAILFDKIPTPGGDHCHLFQRLWAPLGREIYTIGDGMHFIPEREWPAYAKRQVELLAAAGIPQPQAEKCYSEQQVKK